MPGSSPSHKGDSSDGDTTEGDSLESDSSGAHSSDAHGPVTYDSVTVHYRADGEEPLTVKRVHRLADSFFPGSGKRALQVIDDPRKGPPRGLFDVDPILIPPEEISHLVLRKGDEERTVTPEEALGAGPPSFSDSEDS